MPSLPHRIEMVLAPSRTRKLIVITAVVIFVFLYFRSLSFKTEPASVSIEAHLNKLPSCLRTLEPEIKSSLSNLDSVISYSNQKPGGLFMLGNGHVASTPLTGEHLVLLEDGAPLDLGHHVQLAYYMGTSHLPLVLSILNMKKGQVEMYYVGEGCITIKETVFASHLYPSVIAHDVLVHNPLDREAHIDLKISASSHLDNIHSVKLRERSLGIYSDLVRSSLNKPYVAAAGSFLTTKTLTVAKRGDGQARMYVALASKKLADVGERSEKLKEVMSEVEEVMKSVEDETIVKSHTESWTTLRQSGVRLRPLQDHLMAKPLAINMTSYYLLSVYRPGTPLTDSMGCFRGSPSSHSPVLWSPIHSVDSAHSFSLKWAAELVRSGCENHLTGSRLDYYQALLRSFAGLLEGPHGLELALNPHSMEGYINLWGIEYGGTKVNISVTVNTPSHKGQVGVSRYSRKQSDVTLYTCDQACVSDISAVGQGGRATMFSIRPTNPSTPILYIASEEKQLILLRQLIEQHHGLDIHTLEEHPISAVFIIIISVVIVAFHALLFHMIYKEFCSGESRYFKSAK